jgi:class 3 adenylate cyclase/predicted ATPase
MASALDDTGGVQEPALACPSCGADLPAHTKLCPACGAGRHGFCPACRHSISAGARFCAECGVRLPADAVDSPRANPAFPLYAERRQLTVMFCDLVGSTPLALVLDPEDLLEAIGSYQSAVAATVERFGGYVARCFGDGVLVYFGWPQADETDAERAVRAGLAVVDAVGRKSVRGKNLRVRIGIASGVVVVGDINGPEAVQEQAVVGEAPNLGARLQALAEPNTVVISQPTRIQIGDLFDCEDLGMLEVKGYTEPVRAWRVRSENAVQSRFEALYGSRRTPIVGREDEIDLLLRQWHQAKQGEGRVVLVAGEAGIGKSRLIAALEERLHDEAYTRLRYFCAPHHQHSALHPIIGHLERAIDLDRQDAPADKLRKLRAVTASAEFSEEDVGLLAEMLLLPTDGLPALNLSPQRKKEKTFEALNRRLEDLAREHPVLIMLEDVHWSDPTTLELVDLTIDRIQSLPVLLVMTFRSEFRAPRLERTGACLITLGRLDERQSAALVAQLKGGDLPDGLVDRIVAGSDGVPLFIEELTKAVLEKVAFHEPDEAIASAPLAIPNRLEALLMARLDRFPTAKEVAHVGAVIGREFRHGFLAAVAQMPKSSLLQGLDHLIASELVFRRGTPPDAVYIFKHALVQDAAYETVLRSRRSMLHERVVQALLEQVPGVEETQPGLLGHHCARAGQIEKAAWYYRRAGEQSAERAALAETRGQLERGLALLVSLPDNTARGVLEVELKLALGRVLLSTKGNADGEAGNVFAQAVVLCRGLNRIELLTRALWGHWFNKAHRRELAVAEDAAQELLRLGRMQDDAPAQIVAYSMLGITRFWQGRFEEARSNLTATLELYRTGEHPTIDLAIVSDNLEIHAGMQLSLTLACLGYLEAGATHAERATEGAPGLAHLPSRAIVLAVKCRHDWFVRDDKRLRETAAALVTLSEEQGFPFYLSLGRCHLGWLAVKEGRVEEGLGLLRASLDALQSTDAIIWEPYLRGMMAEALVWAGNADEAQHLLDQALKLSVQTGAVWFDAELHRCKGEVPLIRATPDYRLAEECFRQAIAIARSQSAKLWELRAATRLAQVWFHRGKRAEARALLAPVHAWFGQGSETPDVREAAGLLAELAADVSLKGA